MKYFNNNNPTCDWIFPSSVTTQWVELDVGLHLSVNIRPKLAQKAKFGLFCPNIAILIHFIHSFIKNVEKNGN